MSTDLAEIRAKLAESNGKATWQSLEELAETPEFQEYVEREFPRQAAPWFGGMDRRQFIKLMGASLAMAGLTACRPSSIDKIVPYVRVPKEMLPGEPLFYATTLTLNGYGMGVLAQSNTGRPTKIEGNPDHPASLGSTDAFRQAMILSLYDPNRSQSVMNLGNPGTWNGFVEAWRAEKMKRPGGAGIRFLSGTITSPSLRSQIGELLSALPQAQWHTYEPINNDNSAAGATLAFGRPMQCVYRFDRADVVLAIDSDFLHYGPGAVRYARDFATARKVRKDKTTMSRLYSAESSPTNTGAAADHKLRLRASEIESFARALASRLGISAGEANQLNSEVQKFVDAVASDLEARRGSSVVVVGEKQPPIVHAIAHSINTALGSTCVSYIQPVEEPPPESSTRNAVTYESDTDALKRLAADVESGQVKTLVIIGGNPVYDAPADINFAGLLKKLDFAAHLSYYDDETSAYCHWHIPVAHELESWGDARAFDGTVSLMQPLIEPLYGGRSVPEFVSALAGQPKDGQTLLRNYWTKNGFADEKAWRRVVHDGVVPNTAAEPISIAARPLPSATSQPRSGMEIIFQHDFTIWDGRFSNNGWLQELPKPLSKVTWDNFAAFSPRTAQRLGLDKHAGSMGKEWHVPLVKLKYKGREVIAPAWIQPGHPDESVTVTFGYGRTRVGDTGNNIGYNAFALRTTDAQWFDGGLEVEVLPESYPLASTQHQNALEGRNIIRTASIEEYVKNPNFAKEAGETPPREESMYPNREYKGNAWGMSIDTSLCTGCGACVLACVSENNIPVVGKSQVMRGRQMHWLRIDRYYQGNELDNPDIHHMPVLCQHCELAPCEPVCPVAATLHSNEGLNEMVYNRCVGTRYCANNCPYKVRRFNFLQYSNNDTPLIKLMQNPDVTVRGRGVMEKCTYCVQRINAARKYAKKENRPITDGEIATACEGACPSQAIIFGNINDKNARVTKLKAEPQDYSLLGELNTRPRTTYLARIRNTKPELERA